SRAWPTSTAKRDPPSVNTHARAPAGRSTTSSLTALLPREAAHGLEKLLRREGFAEVLVGALPLAPHPVAFLVLRAHHHHRGVLGPPVPLDAAEDFVTVALGHDDVEQEHVGLLLGDLLLQVLAVDQGDHLVPGVPENAFHHRQLGICVVDDHHLAHRGSIPPSLSCARAPPAGPGRGWTDSQPPGKSARPGPVRIAGANFARRPLAGGVAAPVCPMKAGALREDGRTRGEGPTSPPVTLRGTETYKRGTRVAAPTLSATVTSRSRQRTPPRADRSKGG